MNKPKIRKLSSLVIILLIISFASVISFAATYLDGYELFFPNLDGQSVTSQKGPTELVTSGTLTAITYSSSSANQKMSVTLYTANGTSKGTKYINTNNSSAEELKTTLVWSNLVADHYYLKYSISSTSDQWYVDTTLYDGVK